MNLLLKSAEIEAYGADKLKEALMDANKLEREENVMGKS